MKKADLISTMKEHLFFYGNLSEKDKRLFVGIEVMRQGKRMKKSLSHFHPEISCTQAD